MKNNKDNEIIQVNNDGIVKNRYIQHPGDKIMQQMMPSGDVITRVDTKQLKATHRQYMKKDGSNGKQTITLMQLDEDVSDDEKK